MGLIDRFQALFTRHAPAVDPRTTLDEIPRPPGVNAIAEKLKSETDRRGRVQVCRRMYDEDTRADGILHKVARDALKGSVWVTVPDNPDMEKAGNALIERLGLDERLADWFRLTMRDGDTFLEVGIDEEGQIQEISRKPTLQMHRHANAFDKFDDPTRAYWWHSRPWVLDPPTDAVWFSDWQIVHARWAHDEGDTYGRPMFASATGPWKRITEGELDIAIRRKVRAGRRYLHVVEGASEGEIEAYRQRNRHILQDKFAAVADFFSNRRGAIQTIDGDTHVSDIGDVRHHISTFWLASPVPMALMGYAEDLNRDVLEEQTEEYHSALESLNKWVARQLLDPLLERQWLLDGHLPDAYAHTVQFGTKKAISAQTLDQIADALNKLRSGGLLSLETALWVLGQFLPGFDPAAELDRLVDEMNAAGLDVPPEIEQLGMMVRASKMTDLDALLADLVKSKDQDQDKGQAGNDAKSRKGADA